MAGVFFIIILYYFILHKESLTNKCRAYISHTCVSFGLKIKAFGSTGVCVIY